MGLGNLNPGCCYCEDLCTIAADSFGSDTLLATAWDGDTADFTKESGVVTSTTPDVSIIHKTAAPSSTMTAVAKVKGSVNGDQLRVIVAWLDADNYLYGQLEVDAECGELSLWEVVSGTHNLLESASVRCSVLNAFHSLRVCYDDGYLTGKLSALLICANGIRRLIYTPASSSGTRAGIGTGALTGAATFDDFRLSNLKDDADFARCPDCSIPGCLILHADSRVCEWTSCGDDDIWQVPHPDATQDCVAEIFFSYGVTGESVRVIIAADDCDNCLFVQHTHGSSPSVSIVKREAGSNTTLATRGFASAIESQSLRVCRIGDNVIVNLTNPTTTFFLGATTSGFGNKVGFGETLASSESLVDDFVFYRHKSDEHASCPECIGECQVCDPNEPPPAIMTVEIEDVPSSGSCCYPIGGEYELTQRSPCSWAFGGVFTECECDGKFITFSVELTIEEFDGIPIFTVAIRFFVSVSEQFSVGYTYTSITGSTSCRYLPITLTVSGSDELNLRCSETFMTPILCTYQFPATLVLKA